MKKSKSTKARSGIHKEADAGLKVADVCRKHGLSQLTYYNWKSKYGGMSVSELNSKDSSSSQAINNPHSVAVL